ncbi:MAG: hypothetical protein R3E08_04580 [Thiotrichaceae bacterium]
MVYLTKREKYAAIIEDIKDCQKRGQPALVGTASIESSEELAALLQQEKIVHQVLNAKFHLNMTHIISQAGRRHCDQLQPIWQDVAQILCSVVTSKAKLLR